MAIDKSNSPKWVKAVVIIVATGFVLMVVIPMLGTILTQPSGTNGTATNQGSVNTSDTLSAISKQYGSQTQAIDEQLAKDPKNVELLMGQAQQYKSWADAVLAATDSYNEARPMAALSVQYYERAFAITPGDSGDLTDYSAVVFYAGDVEKATTVAEGVVAKDPKYQPAHFNLGVFYGATGRFADAIKAYETALKLDPDGPDAAELKSRIEALKQQASSPSTATP